MGSLTFFFIHGAGGTSSKWRFLQKELKNESIRIIDLPGRGNELHRNSSSVQDFAQYCNEQVTEDVILVGHSLGGLIALETAIDNSKVKGIVLVASHYELPVQPKILEKLQDGVFPDGLFYSSYSKDSSSELLEEEKAEMTFVSTEQTYLDFNACNEYSLGKERASTLTIPIVAVYGENDRMLLKDAQQKLREANKHIKVKVVANAAHYIMLEQPKALADILVEFKNSIQIS